MQAAELPGLDEIDAARERIAGLCVRTPLLKLQYDGAPQNVWLKCENLQPVGAYKNRPQGAVLTTLGPDEAARGVYTASSGNSGIGMAWAARRLQVAARVYAPDTIDEAKAGTLEALGATVERLPYDAWWQIILEGGHPDDRGIYVDAVRDRRALAGNGSIALEILEDLPDVDTVVAPFGGGGLICGLAAVFRRQKPNTRIVAAEVDTARPLAAAMRHGAPVNVPVVPSFIQAIGGSRVLDAMWPLVQMAVDDVTQASLEETCRAMRRLAANGKLVTEGAAAVGLAAVLSGRVEGERIVCVISGGNIALGDFCNVLTGGVPGS